LNPPAITTTLPRPRRSGEQLMIVAIAVALTIAAVLSPLALAVLAGLVVLVLGATRFKPLLWALIFFLPISPFLSWNLLVKDLGTLLRVCIFAGAFVYRVRRGEPIRKWLFSGRLSRWILLYFAVAIVSDFVFNPPTGLALRELMRLASYLCFYYVISDWVRTEDEVNTLAKTLMLSTIGVTIFGFYQIAIGDYSALYNALYPAQEEAVKLPPFSGRITSFLSHYNSLGGYLNMVIPFAIVFSLKARDKVLRRLSWICLVLASVSVLLTQSRGALIAYVAVILLAAWFLAPDRRARFVWVSAVAIASAVGALLAGLIFERLSGVDEFTEVTRLAIWAGAGALFLRSPVAGIGFGNLRSVLAVFIDVENGILDAHNLYLELLSETGILGFGVFMGTIISVLRRARRMLHEERDSMRWMIAFGVLIAISSVLVHGSVDYLFHVSPQVAALFFAILGLFNCRYLSDVSPVES